MQRPTTLDWKEMAEAVKKNNMGLGGFRFQAKASAADGRVTIHPTGQTFPLRGGPPPDTAAAWRTMKVLDWNDPAQTAVEVVR